MGACFHHKKNETNPGLQSNPGTRRFLLREMVSLLCTVYRNRYIIPGGDWGSATIGQKMIDLSMLAEAIVVTLLLSRSMSILRVRAQSLAFRRDDELRCKGRRRRRRHCRPQPAIPSPPFLLQHPCVKFSSAALSTSHQRETTSSIRQRQEQARRFIRG